MIEPLDFAGARAFLLALEIFSGPVHCRVWKIIPNEGMTRYLGLVAAWALALKLKLPLSFFALKNVEICR